MRAAARVARPARPVRWLNPAELGFESPVGGSDPQGSPVESGPGDDHASVPARSASVEISAAAGHCRLPPTKCRFLQGNSLRWRNRLWYGRQFRREQSAQARSGLAVALFVLLPFWSFDNASNPRSFDLWNDHP